MVNGLILALKNYEHHVSDEGNQLQLGLAHAGWTLAGHGYGDGCVDVPTLIDRHRPDVIFVSDVRDWHDRSNICFDKSGHFHRYEALRDHRVATVLKDAGSIPAIQSEFFDAVRPEMLVTYYHEQAVREAATARMPRARLVRTYHSIDASAIPDLTQPRARGIVTGAVSPIYPLRERVWKSKSALDIDAIGHPGYTNRGCDTPRYLAMLAGYKVHVATASRFHFLLRKIVESIACGATPVTNLPAHDVLPVCDEALVRVPDNVSMDELRAVIDAAEQSWDLDRALELSRRACEWFDYRAAGVRLSEALCGSAG